MPDCKVGVHRVVDNILAHGAGGPEFVPRMITSKVY